MEDGSADQIWCLKLKICYKKPKPPHQAQSNLIKGLLMKKIPNFFQGTFMGKQWQISEKQPKKTLKNGQKTRDL